MHIYLHPLYGLIGLNLEIFFRFCLYYKFNTLLLTFCALAIFTADWTAVVNFALFYVGDVLLTGGRRSVSPSLPLPH